MGRAGFETARLRLARLRVEGAEARSIGARHALAISSEALSLESVGIWIFNDRARLIECEQRYVASTIDRSQVHAAATNPSQLTTREREVLQLIATGHTTQEVAEQLNISPHTATRHRANLMQKLGVHNQVELIRVASQRGLILLPRTASGGGAT